ncbi:MAG: 3-deoxy-8-phosphooctulonate synthase [bacterium]
MQQPRTRAIDLPDFSIGGGAPLVLIAGPCVIESYELLLKTAYSLQEITAKLGVPWILKSSYDKANRSGINSFRGPGLDEGLALLEKAKRETGAPVLSDVHETAQVEPASQVLDIIQIPAFLCRQTDLLVAAGKSGKPVNIKKGQFMAPADMQNAAAKVESTGNRHILITERGTSFGYHNLVVDMRSLGIIRKSGYPAVFDATHSVQLPAAQGQASGGEREFVPLLTRAAVAAGVDAIFMEVHPDPENALCDGPNSILLSELEPLLKTLLEIDRATKET